MIISERIFELMKEKELSQKEFSDITGIPQSTISDWRKKRTNPVSEKILLICEALDVTPEYLLSGVEAEDGRSSAAKKYIVPADSELGEIVSAYHHMDQNQRARLKGYLDALEGILAEK